jgi:hypothetical protein
MGAVSFLGGRLLFKTSALRADLLSLSFSSSIFRWMISFSSLIQSVMWGLRPAKTDENRPEPSDTPQWLERRD